MSNKKVFFGLSLVSILIVVGFVVFRITTKNNNTSSESVDVSTEQIIQHQDDSSDNKESNNLQGSVNLTSDEVKKHNSKSDCWTIINGDVYDITDYVGSHPGGSEILRACGIDATSLFTKRETSDGQQVGSGTPHSRSAESELSEYLIGPLSQ
ncbi:cytochrome b5 domain-containing protein [Candidatus Saccharibacteria bacterium]|nr:cytochrome b5 domain-containing protein [Candidatus Saccharibacteria bacterium]